MFCPGCGFQASDDLKFCRQCGANLRGVREAVTSHSTMIHTEEEPRRRRGRASEEKWRDEIKGGVITSFVGIGVMIFLYFFMGVVARQNPADADIVRSLWMVGVVPFMIGIGMIFNGLFITPHLDKLKERFSQTASPATQEPTAPPIAPPAKTTDQLIAAPSAGYSVVEDTTAHLPESVPSPTSRGTR